MPPPTVACIGNLSANLLPGGIFTISVDDLLGFVSDNATPPNQIRLGMRIQGNGTGFPLDDQSKPVLSLSFNCDNLVTPMIMLELWAMDAAGNTALCTTQLLLQDNLGNCNLGMKKAILCTQTMCGDKPIQDAVFTVEGSIGPVHLFELFSISDYNGCASIPNIPSAEQYTIRAAKDNYLDGINQEDFTLLSKHLNGTQPFTEPWQWVAADVNQDNHVTVEDSIMLRQLILGIFPTLSDNAGWRFVPRNYQFPSPNPLSLPIPEAITITDGTAIVDTSFWGIKIGDLNCSAMAFNTDTPDASRNRTELPKGKAESINHHVFTNALAHNRDERDRNAASFSIDLPRPNPTSAGAVIHAYLPWPENLRLEVYDLSGKLLWSDDQPLSQGEQAMRIPVWVLPTPGLYVWRVRAGEMVNTGKLVRK